jgi:hypothetical protein
MTLQSTLLFKDAIKENCLKISEVPNYGATKGEIEKYIFDFVDEYQNGGYVEPLEFYRLSFNKSIELLKEAKEDYKNLDNK